MTFGVKTNDQLLYSFEVELDVRSFLFWKKNDVAVVTYGPAPITGYYLQLFYNTYADRADLFGA